MGFLSDQAEAARLASLHDLRLLDTPVSESFDRITRMATQVFNLPISAISLTDSDRQWFKSRVGVAQTSLPRHLAPCAQIAETCKTLVIEDLQQDPYYRDSPLAKSGVRFYAGAPLITRDGFGLGSMCVLGNEPRQASAAELDALRDLAAMVMAQIELQHSFGRLDPISGLPNRVQFFDDLDDLARDFAGARRFVALFDLIASDQADHASRVMGPDVVDGMIKEAARNLRTILGDRSNAYHVAFAQLACLAPEGLDEAQCRDFLDRLTKPLRAICGSNAIGTMAIGVAPFEVGDAPPSDVLRIAQGAALDARTAGSLFAFHSCNQDTAFKRSYALRGDFEAALQDPGQLRLEYQPRVETRSGRCAGVEALLRWHHPTLGLISPGEFVPLIELTALADPMTAWVLRTAVSQLAQWRAAGLDLAMSVNVSAGNLRDSRFAETVRHIIAAHDVPPEMIELEITETAIMTDAEHALEQLGHLAAAGVRLAIDDFGSGYSSLGYLQRMPVQVVKIDRSFMTDLDTDPRQLSLVTMMIGMAKHLGYRVVAEGVETAAVVERLRATDCDEIQGYFFARPMTAAAFATWLGGRGERTALAA